ncbi:MAG: NPCBM/NEW2 domain-containing protein [Planctomycetota bacterium]
MARRRWLAAACSAAVGLAAALPSQGEPTLEIDLRSGRTLTASAMTGAPADGFKVTVDGRAVTVAARELLAVRRGPAAAPSLLRFELVGGERLYGAIAGGDADGDGLEVLSPVLGKQRVAIDRLEAVVQPGVEEGDQVVPDGVDEALFVPTPRGYDLVAGTLFRFGPQGLEFQAEGRDEARWYAPRKFAALRLRGGVEREAPASCWLWTRTADRLGVQLVRCTEEGVEVSFEGGDAAVVRWLDVGCLVFDDGVRHLSSLAPSEVVERGVDGPAVLGWRRDRSVVGGELVARQRVYGRGLGVHSTSRLTFVAPPGATHFRAAVALDDSVGALPIRAHAVARVRRNGEPVFEAPDLRAGQPVRSVGLHAVAPGDTVTLEVDVGEGRDLGDRVDWLLPMFLLRRGA